MFLSRVALRNVRSIESLQLDFSSSSGDNRRWTLLLGENGCGKSSVLRAIALLLAGSDALADLLSEPDAWIRNGCQSCRIEASLTTARQEAREIALELHRGDRIRDIFDRNEASLNALDAAIHHADRNYFVLGYGVSRRPGGSSKGRASLSDEFIRSPRARGVATMFSADFSLVSLEQWAMDLDYRKGGRALQAVRTALDRLLPGMRFAHIDRETRQLVFETEDGLVPLRQLSDGYQNMAAWCGDLLYRITETFPDRKDPLATRGVLLIDELDLHLHPVWRRQLVEFLSATLPNFQFVATTHSALTAQQSGEGELYVIRREGQAKRPTLLPFVGEPRRMMLHQLLMSPMFGLDTLDSIEIEQARNAVRDLSLRKTALSAADKKELARLKALLRDAPDWDAVPGYAKEQTALLKGIKASLAKDGKPPALSVRKLKAAAKALGAPK
ncbi:MAG: AAA family ATPase [Roseateles sp.]|uniref:AAA family ATPase n=1 Tax=Roseateles sp. TaxID=1971397 RepID=UPI0039EB34C7